jgi:hypothetical protein
MWLDRAHTFKQNWLQIFRPEVAYFDPLVHLMFVVDSFVLNFNYRWYHFVDLAVHATNAVMVYRFARLLDGDERAALFSSILFAGSFTIADAVLWSSSRVDLLSTFFCLAALIQFLHYLRSERRQHLIYSYLLFILALGAKGTPLVLPLVLVWLIVHEKKPLSSTIRLIPFALIALLYLILLKVTVQWAALPLHEPQFNFYNIVIAFCTLFIPESTLSQLNLGVTATLLFITISALGLSVIPAKESIMLRRTGYLFLLTALLPVFILGDFTLVTDHATFIDLMGSPSHRIYLASVGAALLGGGVVRTVEIHLKKNCPRLTSVAIVMFLLGALAVNAYLVRKRDRLWQEEGEKARTIVNYFSSYRNQGADGSQIGLIGFPASRIYMQSVIEDGLGINNANFNYYVDISMHADSEILQKAEKSYLFVFGRDGRIHDVSRMYRQQLLLSRLALNNSNSANNTSAAQSITFELIREINRLIGL